MDPVTELNEEIKKRVGDATPVILAEVLKTYRLREHVMNEHVKGVHCECEYCELQRSIKELRKSLTCWYACRWANRAEHLGPPGEFNHHIRNEEQLMRGLRKRKRELLGLARPSDEALSERMKRWRVG